MSVFRLLSLVCLFSIAGCKHDEAPAPSVPQPISTIDREYFFDSLSCSDSIAPEKCDPFWADHYLDVQVSLRDDHLIDFIPNAWSALPGWTDIVIDQNGNFNQHYDLSDWSGTLSGHVDPQRLEIDWDLNYLHKGVPANRKIHAAGRPSGFLDRSSYRGRYAWHLNTFGSRSDSLICSDQAKEHDNGQRMAVQIYPRPDRPLLISFQNDQVVVALDTDPDSTGALAWEGTVWVREDYGIYVDYDGSLTGTLLPDQVDLVLQIRQPDSASCRFQYAFSESWKRDDGPRDSQYRTRERHWQNVPQDFLVDHLLDVASSDAAAASLGSTYFDTEKTYDLALQEDGSIDLHESFGMIHNLTLDQNNAFDFRADWNMPGGTIERSYRGHLDTKNNRLVYTVYQLYPDGGISLSLVEGRARHLVPWPAATDHSN